MPAPPLAAESLFVYVGAVTAVWAVVLSFLGLRHAQFPPRLGPERLLVALSALLVAASIGTAIGTAKQGRKASEAAATPNAAQAKQAKQAASGPASKLALSADASGQLRFDKTSLQAKAGAVELVLSNPSPLSHNISIQGSGVSAGGPTVGHGGTSTVTATLKPGSYTFYCSVPGHRQAGMQGTLTVR